MTPSDAYEWRSFIARHGPLGRVLTVMLETVELPTLLRSIQYLNALDQDAARVARELAAIVGRPDDLSRDDSRRLLLGQHLVFTMALKDDVLAVTGPDGTTRELTPPWRDAENAARFTAARLGFRQRTDDAITSGAEHADLVRHATALGDFLFGMLFDEDAIRRLERATLSGYPRPLITLRSADDVLLSLPWELLHHDGSFLVRDGRVDLARSTPDDVGPGALVPEPPDVFKLVVNVSAPAGSGLDYEGEAYRITRALAESVELTPTELGTVEDLIETAKRVRPAGLHFSGHGAPGRLQFEDDEGRSHDVDVAELAAELKRRVPGGLPPFFYLASCHGNEPAVPEKGKSASESSAAPCTAPGWRRSWATTDRSRTSCRRAPRRPSTVSPMAPDALYRMMGWFPGLRRLSGEARAELVGRLAGHPRAVEFANDLVAHRLGEWEDERGPWTLSDPPTEAELERERRELLEQALPRVRERLWEDLLLAEIWERVLDERARRMLFRMTLLRVPWEPELNLVLGEPDEPEEQARETAERLRRTSLLEQVELWRATGKGRPERVRRYTLHPATAQFIAERFGEHGELARAAHLRVGEVLEAQARSSPYVETEIEAGHHLLEGGEPDCAGELLVSMSKWLQERGRVREGLGIIEPFLAEPRLRALKRDLAGRLLGTVGSARWRLGEVEKAIGYYEQALVISREIGDRRGEGNVLGNLGIAYSDLGEVEKAIGYYEQALITRREIGDRRGEGTDLGNLGRAYHQLDEVEKAIGAYQQALVVHREIGHRLGEGSVLGNLGLAYADLGEVEKAIRYYDQALVIHREIRHRHGEAHVLGNLGNAYTLLEEVDKAIGYHEQALVISREIGDRRGEGSDLGNLGFAYARLGEVEKAIGLLDQVLRIGQEIKDPQMVRIASAQLEKLRGSSAS